MTNEEVIESLNVAIGRLENQLRELERTKNVPGGPIEERTQRRAEIVSAIELANTELTHLQNRRRDRDAARLLHQVVPPLSEERRRAMEEALREVNTDIVADADFHTVLSTTERIVAGARKASEAGAMG
jgi:hypothetical protein